MVGRLAGDEFCVLLEGCPLATAADVARTALELLGADEQLPLSLSFGAAEAARDTRAGDLLRAADTAQYAAKRRGGGRLCSADPRHLARADSGERRGVRPRGSEAQLERVAGALLDALDGEHAGAPVLDRIEAVAVGFAAAVDAGAWTISRWERGSPVVRSISTAESRDRRLRGMRVALENEVYRLDEFPQTAAALAGGSAGFVARADGEGDPAERRLLVELGFDAVLVATVAHGSGAYLVELYADGRTAALGPAGLRLRMLLRIAADGRTASRVGAQPDR